MYDLTHKAIEYSYRALEAWNNDLTKRIEEVYGRVRIEKNLLSAEHSKSEFNDTIKKLKELHAEITDLEGIQREILPALEEMKNLYDQDSVKNYYFTFGDSPCYPFKTEDYVLVRARDINKAAKCFKYFYPNYDDPFVLNCADYCGENVWKAEKAQYYMDGDKVRHPAVVLDFTDEMGEEVKGRPYIRG